MLDTVNIFKVKFRRNAINEGCLKAHSLGEHVVQTSTGVRLSNIIIAPSFEEVEGFIGLGLSMGKPACESVRGLRLHSFENLWR